MNLAEKIVQDGPYKVDDQLPWWIINNAPSAQMLNELRETLIKFFRQEQQIASLSAELKDYEQLIEMQFKVSRQADKLWQAEDPENRANVWPGLEKLLNWLMDRINQESRKVSAAANEHCGCLGAYPEKVT